MFFREKKKRFLNCTQWNLSEENNAEHPTNSQTAKQSGKYHGIVVWFGLEGILQIV